MTPEEANKYRGDIYNRVTEAEAMFQLRHYTGSLLLLLVAVAATSRRRYPNKTDRKRFCDFLADEMMVLTQNELFGNARTIKLGVKEVGGKLEDILYTHMRCKLVHEGGMNEQIELLPGTQFYIGPMHQGVLRMSMWIIRGLHRVIICCNENSGIFDEHRFWACEPVDIFGMRFWAFEDWVTGELVSDIGPDGIVNRPGPSAPPHVYCKQHLGTVGPGNSHIREPSP